MALTLKQEAFARAYVETGNASEAYRRAYSTKGWKESSVNCNASQMMSDTKIAQRIAELQARAAARNDITLDRLTQMTLAAYKKAEADESLAAGATAMTGAIRQIAKMHGLETEKRPNERSAFSDLPADVRRSLVADIEALARAANGDREGAAVH